MDRLTGDLLDLASIHSGRLAVRSEIGDPSMVAAEVVETFQPLPWPTWYRRMHSSVRSSRSEIFLRHPRAWLMVRPRSIEFPRKTIRLPIVLPRGLICTVSERGHRADLRTALMSRQ